MAALPTVALVGRPNVGKSTLFNVLTRTRDALVHNEAGVTRDRHYGVCRLEDRALCIVVDTGGVSEDSSVLARAIVQQSRAAALAADVIFFVVDARDGPGPVDADILAWLRQCAHPIVLVINKIDGMDPVAVCAEYACYGLPQIFAVSAAHRKGIDPLMEWLSTLSGVLPSEIQTQSVDAPQSIRIACVGRPNVGKSTLINRLLGEERVIASDVPGTTRDAIAVDLVRDNRQYQLIDTAGLRRRARVAPSVEKLSAIKTLQAIEYSQVAVLVIDAREGVTDQDAHVLSAILEAGRALVVAVNKWDGLSAYSRAQTNTVLERKLSFAPWAQVVRISALHGSGLGELFAAITQAYASASREITTSQLNHALQLACQGHPPPASRGQGPKLRYVHRTTLHPPTFVVHGTRLSDIPNSYARYLENFFRQHFNLVGTPIRFQFRQSQNPYEGKANPLTERQIRHRKRMLRFVKRR